jgi:hypothetical protein
LPADAAAVDPLFPPPLNSVVEATEVLMHAQAADASLIARMFGTDPLSPLSFITTVDPLGRSFSYATTTGAMYLGQPISLSGSGTLGGATNTWAWTSNATVGATSWSATGTANIVGDPTLALDWQAIIIPPLPPPLAFDLSGGVRLIRAGPLGLSRGTLTLTFGTVPIGSVVVTDFYNPFTRRWRVLSVGFQVASVPSDPRGNFRPFRIESDGQSPGTGGAGSFTTTISAVPEPSTAALVGVGVVAVVGWRRRRRVALASEWLIPLGPCDDRPESRSGRR